MSGAVRLTLTMQPRPGFEREFVDAWRTVAEVTSRVPGNLRQTLVSRESGPVEIEITSDWTSADAMRRWERSAEQHELTAPIRALRQSVAARVEQIVLHVEAAVE